jgi:replicative DNA helicase
VYRIADEASGLAAPARSRPVGELLIRTLDRIETGQAAAGIATPWEDLNALLGGGWHPGQFAVVASRPQVGKSVLLLNAAVTAALAGVPTLLCTLEMKADECNMRILSAASRIPYTALREGNVTEAGWDRLADKASELSDAPLRINQDGYQTVRTIAGELRRMKREGAPCGLLCVDYLQLMRHPGKWDGNKQGEVSEISRGLKLLCDDFDVAGLVAAQLNRGPEMRASHLPLLADLRDSGSVEQDADVVILLAREDVYNRESPRAGEIDLIVAKHRQGPTATITAAFEGPYLTVTDMAWSPSAKGV